MHRKLVLGLLISLSAVRSSADQVERKLDGALAEIALLKRAVAEQDSRIRALEKALKTLKITPCQSSQETPPSEGVNGVARSTDSPPWTTLSAWRRIKIGMSRSQVVAILGAPTSVDNGSIYQMLFYQGDIYQSGSGSVTGTVKLVDDRTFEVNTPVF